MTFWLALCLAPAVDAASPLACPAGAPLGSFSISVSKPGGGDPLRLEAIDELLPGYRIWYAPAANSARKNKSRVALVMVPSDHGKIVVTDPKPADGPVNWTVPVRTEIVSLVYGPDGLDKDKIVDLVRKNDQIVGQLADYAKKTEETQELIQAITQQQQTLDTGQNVNSAVVSFASRYNGAARIDPTQTSNQQILTLIHGVNPAISAYDPLAQSPTQRAAQTAGLAAAVAGLFFGTNVALAANGGAMLVNMHSLFFPGTEFRSAFAQPVADHKDQTALCGNKTPSATRTELTFFWATRVPDSAAPEIAIAKPVHLPIGVKSPLKIVVKGRDESLAARVQNWRLVSASDSALSVPVDATVNTKAKTVEVDAESPKLKPGAWKLMGDWDWDSLTAGTVDLRPFSHFENARLEPESQNRLVQSSGMTDLELENGDFEFVEKLAYKRSGDPFAQPSSLPFRLPEGPRAGPQFSLETQLDPQSMAAGDYQFLVSQSDGKVHTVPFKVLPAPPQISNLPIAVHTGLDSERITLKGSGLDRIDELSSDDVKIALRDSKKEGERDAEIRLKDATPAGTHITLQMKVTDFEQPIQLPDALVVAGLRPAITSVRASLPGDLGIELRPGEIPDGSMVSVALDVANAPGVIGVSLACDNGPAVAIKLRKQPAAPLFLSFDPATVGQAGCAVMGSLVTANSGNSLPVELGTIVHLPKIDAFRITADKADAGAYYGELTGQGLEGIERVGWNADTGTSVQALPTPVAGGGKQQILKVAVPWPAPAPHAPLYIWLRGEDKGRATTAKW